MLFPGSLALHNRTFSLNEFRGVNFLVRSGRALLLPVYKGTYERGGEVKSDYPETTTFYKDHVIMWGKAQLRGIRMTMATLDRPSSMGRHSRPGMRGAMPVLAMLSNLAISFSQSTSPRPTISVATPSLSLTP